MRSRVLRTGLTLLLSATVFLGSVMPPAVQHAHGGDHQIHDHKTTPAKHAHHQHSHPHQSESQSTIEEFPTWHRHVSFLGWDFHLPTSDSPNCPSPGSGDLGDQFETLVRLFDTNVVVGSAPSVDWVGMGLPLVMDWPLIENEGAISRFGKQTLASLPLCDTARGERSGVQLI